MRRDLEVSNDSVVQFQYWLGFKFVMIILSCNIRGLGRLEKRRAVKILVSCHKPFLLFLQETRLNHFDSRLVKSIGGSLLSKGIGVDVVGFAGGLLTF